MGMKLEDQVVSLELAKKLKSLNVKQESLFYWQADVSNGEAIRVSQGHSRSMYEENFSAFTVAELLESLPSQIYREKRGAQCALTILKATPDFKGFYVEYYDVNTTDDSNLANALAKMLCYLLDNDLLKK